MIDHKLAKGYVRSEMRNLRQGIEDARHALPQAIQEEARSYLWRSRRINGTVLRELAERLDALVTDGLAPVRRRAIYRPPTAARPKSDAYEMAYVSAFPYERDVGADRDRYFDIRSTRLLVTRKRIEIVSTWLGVTFQEHTARRTLQRQGVEEGAPAINAVAKAISENAAMTCLACRCMAADAGDLHGGKPSVHVAIPFANGLLLGKAEAGEGEPAGTRIVFNMHGRKVDSLENPPSLHDAAGMRRIEVSTFVDLGKMSEPQHDLRRRLLAWSERHADAVSALNDDLAWPGAALVEDDAVEWTQEAMDGMVEDAERGIAAIMERARVSGAFHDRIRPAPELPDGGTAAASRFS